MKKESKIIVPSTTRKDRLDSFLSTNLKISRSQVQKLIADDLIVVNGELPKKAGDLLKAGDVINCHPERSAAKSRDPLTHASQRSRDSSIRPSASLGMTTKTPQVVAETLDYLVVNKPSGLLVHPTQADEKDTLVAWLLKKYPEIKTVGDQHPPLPEGGSRGGGSVRPGIVHRLDKEASGLLVVARTQKMFELLKEQFKNRTIEKEYWALVHGKVVKDWDELTFPIARSENFERMAARPLRDLSLPSPLPRRGGEDSSSPQQTVGPPRRVGGREERPGIGDGEKDARTEFFVERRFVNFTLLKVILHTGRMHQIRVHMLAYNHPLVGDPLYTQKKRKRTWDEKCGRLFLHSTKLSFTDLEGERQTFRSELPEELEKFLKTLS